MKNSNRFTLRLSEKQLELLKEAARFEKRTVAAILRNLIDDIKETNQVRKTRNEDGI